MGGEPARASVTAVHPHWIMTASQAAPTPDQAVWWTAWATGCVRKTYACTLDHGGCAHAHGRRSIYERSNARGDSMCISQCGTRTLTLTLRVFMHMSGPVCDVIVCASSCNVTRCACVPASFAPMQTPRQKLPRKTHPGYMLYGKTHRLGCLDARATAQRHARIMYVWAAMNIPVSDVSASHRTR